MFCLHLLDQLTSDHVELELYHKVELSWLKMRALVIVKIMVYCMLFLSIRVKIRNL